MSKYQKAPHPRTRREYAVATGLPFDSPKCSCGHLAFIHASGEYRCSFYRCPCVSVSGEIDPRWGDKQYRLKDKAARSCRK